MDDQTNGPRSHVGGASTRVRPARPIRFTPSRTEPVQPRSAEPQSAAEQPSLFGQVAAWIAIAIGWSIFVAWWVIVLQRESLRSFGVALGLVGATIAASAILMTFWTRYNIRIAKKGKRGQSSLFIPMEWERDTLGRSLELPEADVARSAAEVRLVIKGTVKAYVVPDAEEL